MDTLDTQLHPATESETETITAEAVSASAPAAVLPQQVEFDSVLVYDDTDFTTGAGEIYFRFKVNGTTHVTGRYTISSDQTVEFRSEDRIMAIPQGATGVTVSVEARDDDTYGWGDNNPFVAPDQYQSLGSASRTWTSSENYGRGSQSLTLAKCKVSFIIS